MTTPAHDCKQSLVVVHGFEEKNRKGVKKQPCNKYRCTVCSRVYKGDEVFLRDTDVLMRKEAV